ncbi:MAG: hypothetical protein JO227_01915 [Acetobacteraceae bacterium]|nr:hypothetical protein [Acetobacteraceae bacterium]
MNQIAQGATGVMLALALLLLAERSTFRGGAIVAVQSIAAAVLLSALSHPVLAIAEAGWGAVATPWIARGLTIRVPSADPKPVQTTIVRLTAGAALAGLGIVTGGEHGTALAIALCSVMVAASARHLAEELFGLTSLQNAVVALAIGASDFAILLAITPLLPGLAAAARWWQAQAPHAQNGPARRTLGITACVAALPIAGMIVAHVGSQTGPFRIDTLTGYGALLGSIAALVTRWTAARPPRLPSNAVDGVMLAAFFIAFASHEAIVTWLASFGAVAASLATSGSRHVLRACVGSGLTLAGTVILPTLPAVSTACMLCGYGLLASLSPPLAVLGVVMIMRQHIVLAGADEGAAMETLLVAAGLLLLLGSATLLMLSNEARRTAALVAAGQVGVGICALGAGASATAAIHFVLLLLTWSVVRLGGANGGISTQGFTGLAGIPPFGMFPSLAAILAHVASEAAWPLLLLLLLGVLAMGWGVLRCHYPRQPEGRSAWIAWIPMLALLVLGYAMPAPIYAWFEAAAAPGQ